MSANNSNLENLDMTTGHSAHTDEYGGIRGQSLKLTTKPVSAHRLKPPF